MAIFPPQISPADFERLSRLRAGRKPAELQGGDETPAADKKANVVRPPLSKALAEELRRFAKDESGFSFIDWAITVSLISMLVGFFIPDLWAVFDEVMQSVNDDVNGVAFTVKYLN